MSRGVYALAEGFACKTVRGRLKGRHAATQKRANESKRGRGFCVLGIETEQKTQLTWTAETRARSHAGGVLCLLFGCVEGEREREREHLRAG